MYNDDQELEKLIARYGNSLEGKLWRGSHAKRNIINHQKSINTGYKSINKQLHSNGWPLGTTNEFGIMQHGIGELRLLIPALREAQEVSQQKQIILVAPPYTPFAPALVKEGLELGSLTIIKTRTLKDSLWATEQSLIANCCAAVICWTGTHKINNHDLRRLQLAAEKTRSWSVLFRHSNCLEESSVSGLRIQLNSNSYSKLELNILKQPQGWGGQRCTISLKPHYENWQRLAVSLLPVHTPNRHEIKAIKLTTFQEKESENIAHPKAWNSSVSVICSLSALRAVH
jgi:protein ImuA